MVAARTPARAAASASDRRVVVLEARPHGSVDVGGDRVVEVRDEDDQPPRDGATWIEVDPPPYAARPAVSRRQEAQKYIVQNVAHAYGKSATFMAKPVADEPGSGMSVHQAIWRDGKPLFAGDKYADLSQEALYFIGGILKHAKALNAITNPSTNSYKRLIPGFEAPVLRAYSARNRSASCRIPFSGSPKGKRVEVRFPDPTANPYLAFAAMRLVTRFGPLRALVARMQADSLVSDSVAVRLRGTRLPTRPRCPQYCCRRPVPASTSTATSRCGAMPSSAWCQR